jgi:hypothetical protein
MKSALLLLCLCLIQWAGHADQTPQQRYEEAVKEVAKATTDGGRLFALAKAAKEGFAAGKIEEARNHATNLLGFAATCRTNVLYGSAIQDGNIVLGRIALQKDRVEEAKRRLIEAGKAPSSPVRKTFGPNMSLAKELLERKEKDVVLEYLTLCRKFWVHDFGKLDTWEEEIKAGEIPNFGANLRY